MVLLPATVSNDVPGTDYTLGSDTCLNALIEFSDTCRQSASSSRRRVFVVETQGAESGYIAVIAGLAVGALAVYTPEEGIDAKMLVDDIDHLRDMFARDHGQNKGGKIILRNEKASKTYTTQVIADIINEEDKGRFDARVGIPGHFQKGKRPSPVDRIRAIRFGVRSLQYLETYAGKSRDEVYLDPMSVAVIGIREAKMGFGSMERIIADETDWKHRRPKKQHWAALKILQATLSGRETTNAHGPIQVMPI